MSKIPIKCVIVAAGMSTRLRPKTESLPKCLLPIGNKTILERTIKGLLDVRVRDIALVVGFEAEKIRAHLKERFPGNKFHFILNPNFASTNNAYSLLLARRFFLRSERQLNASEFLLILDSDIVFHPGLLLRIIAHQGENKFAVRVQGDHDEEEVRVRTNNSGDIVKIGKDVSLKLSYGESIGVEMFDHRTGILLFDVLERRVRRGSGRSEYYEMAFQELIDQDTKIKAVDVGDLPVAEIDSPADLDHAERAIVPRIDSISHVRVQ